MKKADYLSDAIIRSFRKFQIFNLFVSSMDMRCMR